MYNINDLQAFLEEHGISMDEYIEYYYGTKLQIQEYSDINNSNRDEIIIIKSIMDKLQSPINRR